MTDVMVYQNINDLASRMGRLEVRRVPFRADSVVTIVSKAANYMATSADCVILYDASGGNGTVALPTAVGIAGRVYQVKKADSSGYTVTVDGYGAETIDGATTQTLSAQYNAISIVSNGTAWYVKSENIGTGPGGAHNILSVTHSDTLADTVVLGDVPHGNATPKWARLAGNITTTKKYLSQIGTGAVSAVPAWAQVAVGDISGGAALTKTDDTNVTLALGGAPTTALLAATSLTLGWTGILAVARGGTGLSAGTSGGILGYTAAGTIASSTLLADNVLVVGGGAGVLPNTLAAGLGTTTTLLHGNAAGEPTWAAVSYADIAAMTSAQLAGIISDETGSGALVFAGTPTLTGLTVNSATITLSQDTNFVLSGGVNGVSFNTDTLSIDATNGRVGIGTTGDRKSVV